MTRFPDIKTEKKPQVYFDDIQVGSEITPLVKGPYTVVQMAIFASVIRNFSPTHYDNRWSEKMGFPAAIAPGLQVSVYLSQAVTDWMGPNGTLKEFAAQTRGMTLDRDTLTMTGKITRKYTKDGENCVDCELWSRRQDGSLAMKGSATVALPARGGGTGR